MVWEQERNRGEEGNWMPHFEVRYDTTKVFRLYSVRWQGNRQGFFRLVQNINLYNALLKKIPL